MFVVGLDHPTIQDNYMIDHSEFYILAQNLEQLVAHFLHTQNLDAAQPETATLVWLAFRQAQADWCHAEKRQARAEDRGVYKIERWTERDIRAALFSLKIKEEWDLLAKLQNRIKFCGTENIEAIRILTKAATGREDVIDEAR